ncbi:MAG TPA: MAP7 domain-containing protein [Bacteroidales bacterium]|nr:MAP7 domain-containing protein [Bacteroidales bacterium]
MSAGKKKYSLIYRVYRRLRYIRYVRRLRKAEARQLEATRKDEAKQRERILRDQLRADKISDREKLRRERQEMLEAQRKLQEDLKADPRAYLKAKKERKDRERKESEISRRRRKRVLKVYRKACGRNMIKTISSFNPMRLPELIGYIRRNRTDAQNFTVIAIHSTLFYAAAYLLIFMITQLTSAISGIFFEYKSIIYHYDVLWLVKPSQWFGDSVKMVYASGPVVVVIVALVLAIIFSYLRTERGLAKLFILWAFLHGFTAFLGALLIGSLFGRGMGYAIIWSYISDTSKVIYSIISITAMLLLGLFSSRSFLISANSYFPKLETHRQGYFIWAQVVIPFLLGNMIILAIMSPHLIVYNIVVALCMAITIIPVVIGYRFIPSLYFEEEPIRIRLRPLSIFYALLFIILYRLIFGIGIPMG